MGKTYTANTGEAEAEEGKSNFPNNAFTPGAVKPFLSRWISQDLDCEFELSKVILDLTRCDIADRSVALELMEDTLETYAMLYFQGDISYVEMHCIAVSMLDLLETYRNFMIYDKIMDILDVYVLPESHVSNDETSRLTSLSFTLNVED